MTAPAWPAVAFTVERPARPIGTRVLGAIVARTTAHGAELAVYGALTNPPAPSSPEERDLIARREPELRERLAEAIQAPA